MNSETKRIIFQIGLFVITFITTTLAGTEWVYGRSVFTTDYSWADFVKGLEFSIPLLLILTVHEFGHYFVAMYHKVKTSLPYYIPIPPIPFLPFSLGTMGAVIRLRSKPRSNVENFDIGLAGPLAGFIVALAVMFYGFRTLPSPEYVFQFHPDYKKFGVHYADYVYKPEYIDEKKKEAGITRGIMVIDITIGTNLLFWIFEKTVADPARVPNKHELMHYPILLAAYIALLVTCLNLLPIGQLDGGHVIYGLFGYRTHRIIATVFFVALIFYAGLGLSYIRPNQPKSDLLLGVFGYLVFLYVSFKGLKLSTKDTIMYALLMFAVQFAITQFFPRVTGYEGWLLFGLLLGRVIGIEHPPSEIEQPLDGKRIALGWFTLFIFILCFSPAPVVVTGI